MEFCNNPEVLKVIMYIKIILKIVFWLLPILLLLMMGIDIFKGVIASDENSMNINSKNVIKRVIYCVVIFFVPTIVSLVISMVDESLETENSFLTCLTDASSEKIDQKTLEYATSKLNEALVSNSLSDIETALSYLDGIKDNEIKSELEQKATMAKNAIIDDIKAIQESDEAIRLVVNNNNSNYYYYNMDSPDSQDDYTMYVDPDPNYVSRSVTVTEEEKTMIITTISNEQGACKAGAVATAQTIRDTYLYLSGYDYTGGFMTIKGVITIAFLPDYVYTPKSTELAEWAYDYVFVQGNSFYPRKFTGQRGFVTNAAEKEYGYYEVFQLKSHFDREGYKDYITDPTYIYTYNIGNSNLDSNGSLEDYINPNAKVK